MNGASRQPDGLEEAIRVLVAAGAVFSIPERTGSLSLESAAAELDLKAGWMRDHLDEFPGWYRLPAGQASGRNVGEIRIPKRDIDAFERRRQKARAA